MAGVSRIYTYRLAVPEDQLSMMAAMESMIVLLKKHNKFVQDVTVSIIKADDEVEIVLRMHGHDQWLIKKKVIYPLAALLTKAGMKLRDARLTAVDKPPDSRSTRERASDGRSNPDPDRMIEHENLVP